MYSFSFERLDVWQLSRKLVKDVYLAIKLFPVEERYALTNQLQRAVISVVSNIAEGSSRNSLKDQIRFIEIAYGSLMETYTQLCIALDLCYISEEEFSLFDLKIKEISNKLNALRNNYLHKIESNNQLNK